VAKIIIEYLFSSIMVCHFLVMKGVCGTHLGNRRRDIFLLLYDARGSFRITGGKEVLRSIGQTSIKYLQLCNRMASSPTALKIPDCKVAE